MFYIGDRIIKNKPYVHRTRTVINFDKKDYKTFIKRRFINKYVKLSRLAKSFVEETYKLYE